MGPLLARLTKRLIVLAVGAFFIYLAFWHVLPFFDNRTPIALALLITYVVMAYVIIPLLFRVYRFFYHPVHLPLYCTTPDGFASDPINIALVGTRQQVLKAMQMAGWQLADKHTPLNVLREIMAAITGHPYSNAPMSRLYLFGRKQDFGFQVPIAGRRAARHHVRFWAADLQLTDELKHHVRFWHRFYRPTHPDPTAQLWVGAASKDVGLAPIRHNAQLTHMIDPNTNRERRKIVRDLKHANKLASTRTITVNRPFALRNRALRGYLHSDGKIAICELR
ncbi:MAG TPA: LssY C-terminal domain-containing protein [Candidatus Saccharimonadales bacterium]|nr:LssY C-terminal domain-containing protein [Candidatus Saccharimonadales bacterium]